MARVPEIHATKEIAMAEATEASREQVRAPSQSSHHGRIQAHTVTLVGTNCTEGTTVRIAPEEKAYLAIKRRQRETIQWEAV